MFYYFIIMKIILDLLFINSSKFYLIPWGFTSMTSVASYESRDV